MTRPLTKVGCRALSDQQRGERVAPALAVLKARQTKRARSRQLDRSSRTRRWVYRCLVNDDSGAERGMLPSNTNSAFLGASQVRHFRKWPELVGEIQDSGSRRSCGCEQKRKYSGDVLEDGCQGLSCRAPGLRMGATLPRATVSVLPRATAQLLLTPHNKNFFRARRYPPSPMGFESHRIAYLSSTLPRHCSPKGDQ